MATIKDAIAIGSKLMQVRDLARAEEVFRKVVELDPALAEGWFLLGAVNQLRGNLDRAVDSYARALQIDPRHHEALNNLGVALHAQGKFAEAVASLRQAVVVKPDYADAHSNLGNACQEQGALEEAVAAYREALRFSPGHFDAHNNLGNALHAQAKFDLAAASYERALAIKPDHPQIRLSRALAWLSTGDFERGWPEYEWRLKCPEFAIPQFRQPLWDGGDLTGRTILLYADHGLGDSIQFIRYAPLVKARGPRVIVVCRQPLVRLFESCAGVDQVIAEGTAYPDFDVYAPLMSLPRIFGTTIENIPASVPYLAPPAESVDRWRRELAPAKGLRIGIAWQGNPHYRRDRQRSFRLAEFEPVANVQGVRLFSLQKEFGAEQIDQLNGLFTVTDLGARFDDLAETAAAMMNLDLVIVSDSSLAHLAGALAVKAWVALPIAADWRWNSPGDSTPWYQTLRLFRQKTWGDWNDVFRRMASALSTGADI
jgi:Flp pilus assembly protein TadD